MNRTLWFKKNLKADSADPTHVDEKYEKVAEIEEANLVGSLLETTPFSKGDEHAPCIDIDLRCELVESSTPGHFHLYIDKRMTWDQYRLLLLAMVEAGVVERNYYEASVRHGQTFVRKPGLTKATS